MISAHIRSFTSFWCLIRRRNSSTHSNTKLVSQRLCKMRAIIQPSRKTLPQMIKTTIWSVLVHRRVVPKLQPIYNKRPKNRTKRRALSFYCDWKTKNLNLPLHVYVYNTLEYSTVKRITALASYSTARSLWSHPGQQIEDCFFYSFNPNNMVQLTNNLSQLNCKIWIENGKKTNNRSKTRNVSWNENSNDQSYSGHQRQSGSGT